MIALKFLVYCGLMIVFSLVIVSTFFGDIEPWEEITLKDWFNEQPLILKIMYLIALGCILYIVLLIISALIYW